MKSADNIPINNIYYLLCYVWNGLEEGKTIAVNTEDSHTLFDLFARVTINSTSYLFKKGLERDYTTQNSIVTGIKGKLDIATTVKRGLVLTGNTYCSFDDFSYNNIHNCILKSSILHLLKIEGLNKKLKQQLFRLYQRFHGVQNIVLSKAVFSKIHTYSFNADRHCFRA
ncbi:MAG: hypothetical protein R3E32_22620 [Chitinophagales bacterium]